MSFPRPFFRVAVLSAALAASHSPATRAAEPVALNPLPLCPEAALSLGQPSGIKRTPVSADQAIEVSSDSARVDIAGDATVAGKVVVRQGDRRLTADEVRIDTAHNGIDVNGNVEYADPELQVRGEAGRYEGGTAQFQGADFQFLQQPSRGHAGSLSLDAQGVLRLGDVRYTTCPPDSTDWQIKAGSVSLDTARQQGVARNAKIEFKGVPIVYLPWISFPVGPARKSGFLFPSLGSSSRGGLQLSAPYYLNLAPNYDLALEPTLYTRRGLDLRADFRYLTTRSRGSIDANFLPNDQALGQSRGRVRVSNVTELPGDWRLRIGAENVSDVAYFEDFAQGADGTSIAFVPRELALSYRDANWRSGAVLRNYQTIDKDLTGIERPYTELPRLYANGWWTRPGALPLEYGFESEAVDFQRNLGVQGWRLDLQPSAQLRYEGPGYFLRPSVGFRSTAYQLTDTAVGQDRSPTRNVPVVSLDTGLLFERAAGNQGRRRVTLEPRLMYLYVPYRQQDGLPVFDTGTPDLNWVELFRNNRYVGADRVGDANQLSTGVTMRLFASDSGTRFLSATVGQTIYFTQPQVLLPGETAPAGQSSDLISQVELKAFQNWSVDLGMQWDHRDSRAAKSEVRVQYRPEGNRVVNLGYRFQRDRLEQADVSVAWPVSAQWNLYGRTLYSLRDRSAIEQFAGFEYSSCCWAVRTVARHYVSNRSGERDTGIFLQLELKGLSNVGTAANAFLERAIRGYSPTSQKH